jgi:hypothetical protein
MTATVITIFILLHALFAGVLKAIADKIQSTEYYRRYDWTSKYLIFADGTPVPHGDRKYSKLRRLYNYLFNVKYQELHLFSTTLLVWTTDAWHFTNFARHFVCCMAVYFLIYKKYHDTFVMVGIPLSFLLGFHLYNFDKNEKK